MTAAAARRSRESTGPGRRSVLSTRQSSRPASQLVRPDFMRPSLRVIDQTSIRSRARRRTMAIVTFVVLLAGFFAVALIQAQLVADQHQLDVLRGRIMEAEAERARLQRAVEESSAPAAIIGRAQELGMVRATDPVYLAAVAPAPRVAQPIALVPETAPFSGVQIAAGSTEATDHGAVRAGADVDAALGSTEAATALSGDPAPQVPTTAAIATTTDAGSMTESQTATQVLTTVAGVRAVSGGVDSAVAGSTGLHSG